MDIREFDDANIAEINNYVSTQIPQSALPQLFILTENPEKKAKIFISIFRILKGARDFSSSETLKVSMDKLLEKPEKIYNEIYPLYVSIEEKQFGSFKKKKKMLKFVLKYNDEIRFLINSFLVFAEKQELIPIDTVSGVQLDNEEGKDLYNKIIKHA